MSDSSSQSLSSSAVRRQAYIPPKGSVKSKTVVKSNETSVSLKSSNGSVSTTESFRESLWNMVEKAAKEIEHRENSLKRREQSVNDKEKKLAELQTSLAAQGKELQQREESLAKREVELAKEEESQRKKVAELQEMVRSKSSEASQSKDALQSVTQQMANLKSNIRQIEGERDSLRSRISQQMHQHDQIRPEQMRVQDGDDDQHNQRDDRRPGWDPEASPAFHQHYDRSQGPNGNFLDRSGSNGEGSENDAEVDDRNLHHLAPFPYPPHMQPSPPPPPGGFPFPHQPPIHYPHPQPGFHPHFPQRSGHPGPHPGPHPPGGFPFPLQPGFFSGPGPHPHPPVPGRGPPTLIAHGGGHPGSDAMLSQGNESGEPHWQEHHDHPSRPVFPGEDSHLIHSHHEGHSNSSHPPPPHDRWQQNWRYGPN